MPRISLDEWPALLERQRLLLRPTVSAALEAGGLAAEKIAKAKIGHYQPPVWPIFNRWAKLAESTLEQKIRLGYAPPDNPLLREGDLRESIGHAVEGMKLWLGSTSKVGLWQEQGTSNGVPPRPFISPALVEAQPTVKKAVARCLKRLLGSTRPSGPVKP